MNNNVLHQEKNNNLEWPYQGIRKLFLELTRNCERKCVHCYNNSSPSGMKELSKSLKGDINFMTQELWDEVLEQASDLNADHIQFTGGEPTRVPYLKKLLRKAVELKFPRIELYTNCATLPSDNFVSFIKKNKIGIGTSFYSVDPSEHKKIVGRDDWEITVQSIKKYLENNVDLRVGLILMETNESNCNETTEFLIKLGVDRSDINYDNVRPFGRAIKELNSEKEYCDPHDPDLMTHLCGKCYKNISIQPSGHISPCVFWQKPLGIFPVNSLAEVLKSQELWKVRSDIVATNQRHLDVLGVNNSDCSPACMPDSECSPDNQCAPDRKKPTCQYEECIIEGLGKTNEAEELRILRQYRDEILLNDELGRVLVHLYYKISPKIAIQLNLNKELSYKSVYKKVIKPLCESIEYSDFFNSINEYAKGLVYLAVNLETNKEFVINELISLENSESVPEKFFSKYLDNKTYEKIIKDDAKV